MNGRQLELESGTYTKQKGALAAKVGAAAAPSAGAGVGEATGTDPAAGAGPVIAIFRAAKVDLIPNTRTAFRLTAPFTFVTPPVETSER